MIAIAYTRDLKEVQSDALLGPLLSADRQRAPFDRLAWWQALEQHCGLAPLMAIARDGDDAAVLPLTLGKDGPRALANWYTFRFRPILTDGHAAPALLAALARDLAGAHARIVLSGLPDEDGSATLVERAFRAAGWLGIRAECDTNHVLALQGRDYQTYLSGRPGPLRTTLKRKSGKVDVRVLTHFDPAIWAAYEDIYAESWKPEEGSPAFLRAFAEAEGAAGRLRLGIAHVGGEPVAAQMWTVEGGTAFIHKLAHRESAKGVSPGSVLSAALFRHVIDVDLVSGIDFGTGDNPYKRDWMELVRPRYSLTLIRPAAPRNWPFLAKFALRRLARWAKRG
ncbi:GNAT family N-acetyltransferase [Novosphingobium colocasiae]|uniref:BioF2-like acetyltransferase domain-containing protein n=1 Tax=Novosphingobium colocasiae TaxID=1256513 RepID=A0A918UH57_9SPHN|nr:GNAT family N-acetyltransferase [Novosphingobium colocasiae]GGZ08530.1 hypothetical protein GCM10011614_24250 [Novosphingobium colocasiae]